MYNGFFKMPWVTWPLLTVKLPVLRQSISTGSMFARQSADLRTRDTIVFGAFVKADPSSEPLSSVDTIYRVVKFC